MANSVGNLFTKYSATYSKAGGEDADRVPLTAKELKKASRNELRGFDGDILRVSKRGGNFLDRVVCWLERRVFSLTRSGQRDSSRQKHSQEFAAHVGDALAEIGVGAEGEGKHDLIRKIESVQKRDLPLRSGFVQSILQEVAALQRNAGQGVLPDIAKTAFPAAAEVIHQEEFRDQGVVVPGEPGYEPRRAAEVGHGDRDEGLPQVPANRDNEPVIVPQNLPEPHHFVPGWNAGHEPRQHKAPLRAPEQQLQVPQAPQFREYARVPDLAPEPAPEGAVGEGFKFAQQNNEDFRNSLLEPVKTKLVNPVLREKGFYDEITQEKTNAADRITSEMVDRVIQHYGGPQKAKEAVDENLGLVRFAENLNLNENQLQSQALQNVITDLANNKKNEMDEAVNGFYEVEMNAAIGDPQQQAPDQPPQEPQAVHAPLDREDVQEAIPAPQLQENVRAPAPVPEAAPEGAVGEGFKFVQQSDQDFKNSLFEPVKTKLVNPVLREKGFYVEVTQEKTDTADRIASDMVGRVIQHYGDAQKTKEAVDENLYLLKLANRETLSENQLRNIALENIIKGLATHEKDKMNATANELYEAEIGGQQHQVPLPAPVQLPQEPQAPQDQPVHAPLDREEVQAAIPAPQLQENVRAPALAPDLAHAEPVEGAFQFAQQSDQDFRNSLLDPVKTKLVNPVLRDKGFYNEVTQEKTGTADRIASDMVSHVIDYYGGAQQAKEAVDENLGLLKMGDHEGLGENQLQNLALKNVIEGLAANQKGDMNAAVGRIYGVIVDGAQFEDPQQQVPEAQGGYAPLPQNLVATLRAPLPRHDATAQGAPQAPQRQAAARVQIPTGPESEQLAEPVQGDFNRSGLNVPEERSNKPEAVYQNVSIDNVKANDSAVPIQPKSLDDFAEMSVQAFSERLGVYTRDKLVGSSLTEELQRRNNSRITDKAHDRIVSQVTSELAKITFGEVNGDSMRSTYDFAQNLHAERRTANDSLQTPHPPEKLIHDVFMTVANNMCEGKEEWVKSYISSEIDTMVAVPLAANANQSIPQQAPVHDPVRAEAVEGTFQFANQNNDDFMKSLTGVVKTKLVVPELHKRGFYAGRNTDDKLSTNDVIASRMTGHIIVLYGNVQNVKTAADKSLAELGVAKNTGDNNNQVQALGNMIENLSADRASNMDSAFNVVYDGQIQILQQQAQARPPQAASQAPQLGEGARVQHLNPAPDAAGPAIGGFQFAQQSNEDFKASLFEPVKDKFVKPFLDKKGFYVHGFSNAKLATAENITTSMVDKVIGYYGGDAQAKKEVDDMLGILNLTKDPGDTEKQMQNLALNNTIEKLGAEQTQLMNNFVEVVYDTEIKNPQQQAPILQRQAPQAPQLEEGARVQPLNLDPVPAEPAIEGFQFTQQSDEAFKASLFDLITAKLVYPVLVKKGLYVNPTQESMANAKVILDAITTDMGNYVIDKNGGYMQVKNVASENLGLLRAVADPNDTDEQLQKNALNAVIDGWITNDEVGINATVEDMYERRVGGAAEASGEVPLQQWAPHEQPLLAPDAVAIQQPQEQRQQGFVPPVHDDFSQAVGSMRLPQQPQAQRVAPLVDQPLGAPDSLQGAEAIGIDQQNFNPAKENAINIFLGRLEKNVLKNLVRAAAYEVIEEAGYDNATGIESDYKSLAHPTYAEHISKNTWEKHKRFAIKAFSNNYDIQQNNAIRDHEQLNLNVVEEQAMKVFIINFKADFRKDLPKIKSQV